jgi:hypothetical protein
MKRSDKNIYHSMRRHKEKWAILTGILILTGTLYQCIDPFSPKVENFESLLVVDALITDEDASYYCTLSRSVASLDETPETVTGATVFVQDDLDASFSFGEVLPGVYQSDNLSFRAAAGRSYTLHIITGEERYESDPVTMLEAPEIDSLSYGKDKETSDDGVLHEGIRIYLNSQKPADGTYFRWTYEEWWKTHVPFVKLFDYIDEGNIIPVTEPGNVTCWRNNMSDEIILGSVEADLSSRFEKKPLLFIASDQADRLMVQYYIKVRQYSISKNEYAFRDYMKQLNAAGGDIFDRQPFQIFSNIHNPDKPGEQVLGYFQVSAVREASMYITRREIDALDLKQFDYGCDILFLNPNDDFPNKPPKPVTFTQLYYIMVDAGYVFINYSVGELGELTKLIFVKDYCSDCTVTGTPDKPDFWIDME